jgi:lysylphosphatidylglycerol synthetase-like protein (DUF2156 family)
MNNINTSLERRLELVKEYGSGTMAYSTLQRSSQGANILQYFEPDKNGFIAYTEADVLGKRTIALGDPIAPASQKEALIQAFSSHFSHPVFFQAGYETGQLLEQNGFYVNRFGTDTLVDVPEFKTTGNKMEAIRRQINNDSKEGIIVQELPIETVSRKELDAITQQWIQSRMVKTGEMSFLVRPALSEPEPYVRKLFAIKDGSIVGFAYYDPIFKEGQTIGYFAGINRTLPNAPNGTAYLLDVTMIQKLKDETMPLFSLGLSPFSQVTEDQPFKHSKFTEWYFNFNYKNFNSLYNYKGQEQRKRTYRGRQEPVFFASKGRAIQPVLDVLATYKACNIDIPAQVKQAFSNLFHTS